MKYWKNEKLALIFVGIVASALILAACASNKNGSGEMPEIEAEIAAIHSRIGDAVLTVTPSQLDEIGFELGDVISLETEGGEFFEMPICADYSDVEIGKPLLKLSEKSAELAINMGDFAKTAKISVGNAVLISGVEKSGYLSALENRRMMRARSRSDCVSDAAFANFRDITTGRIAQNRIYRGCSPAADSAVAPYADKLIEAANIKTAISVEGKGAFEGKSERSHFMSLAQNSGVLFLSVGVDFESDKFASAVKQAVEFLASRPNETPYFLCSGEGGGACAFISMLIEGVCGASVEEMAEGYVQSYADRCRIKKGTPQYAAMLDNFRGMLAKINGGVEATDATVGKICGNYLLSRAAVAPATIASLKKNLCD